jgi:Domain of unknown function (DUF4279)
MKPVPPNVASNAPEGTKWFGGAVDRSILSLRVACADMNCDQISDLLGHQSDREVKHWALHAPESSDGDLDAQVEWILSRLTQDLAVWREITQRCKADLFCGLFLELPNRGVSLRPETLTQIAARGISLGFDIYAPDHAQA